MRDLLLKNFRDFIRQNRDKIFRAIIILFLLILVVISVSHLNLTMIQTVIQKNRPYSALISLLVYGLLGFTPVPSEPLTVFLASIDGPLFAMLVATTGNTLAALVEFFIGGSIGDISDFEKKKARLPFKLGRLPIDSPIFLLVGRMLPGFGPKFVSIVSGVYKVPIFTYIWTTLVSNLLGASIIAYGGFGLVNLF